MIYQNFIIPYDYIIIIICLILIIISSWKGFVKSILSLLTWIGSVIITIYSYDALGIFISSGLKCYVACLFKVSFATDRYWDLL